MPLVRAGLAGWLLVLLLLSSCQSDSPAPAGITAENYLTTIPDPKTLGESYVSDPDTLLQPGTVAALNARLDSLDRSGRAHIDVVLVRSIGEAVPKTAAYELFNRWKIGSQSASNGLLLLLVLDQRRVEFETGYGLEADLPDIICYRIQQRYMVAPARAGNYDLAMQQGVAALIRRLRPTPALVRPPLRTAADSTRYYLDSLQQALEVQHGLRPAAPAPLDTALPDEAPADDYSPPGTDLPFGIFGVALLALILYLVLWYGTTREVRGRGWLFLVPVVLVISLLIASLGYGIASTTGTFLALAYALPLLYLHGYFAWQYRRAQRPVLPLDRPEAYRQRQLAHRGLGFTAYLFPVGLVLYWPWYRRHLAALRDAPFACPECGQPMHRLAGPAEKVRLAPGQRAEETLRSIDYDVWACPDGHHVPLAYPSLDTEAQECPACHYRTLTPRGLRVEQAATTRAEGWGWQVEKCRFCQHEKKTRETIPRLPDPNQRAAAGGSSSSWGSSSGSSSGGRSTSSGGSSGGGGAGSSW